MTFESRAFSAKFANAVASSVAEEYRFLNVFFQASNSALLASSEDRYRELL